MTAELLRSYSYPVLCSIFPTAARKFEKLQKITRSPSHVCVLQGDCRGCVPAAACSLAMVAPRGHTASRDVRLSSSQFPLIRYALCYKKKLGSRNSKRRVCRWLLLQTEGIVCEVRDSGTRSLLLSCTHENVIITIMCGGISAPLSKYSILPIAHVCSEEHTLPRRNGTPEFRLLMVVSNCGVDLQDADLATLA